MELLKEISTNTGLNALLVLACSFLPPLAAKRHPLPFGASVGVLFGLMAVVSMQFPVTVVPGVIIDSRTVLTALSGAFYGPWSALASLAVAGAYRVAIGGVGVVSGLEILGSAAALGWLFWLVSPRSKPMLLLPALVILGALVGLTAVAWTLTLPEPIRWHVFSATLVPVPVSYALSLTVFGGLLHAVLARQEGELRLKENLDEKRLLLREIYHRTKNNMAVIVSFLRMGQEGLGDPRVKDVFDQAENRIQAMALVHEKLYEAEDLSSIELKDYLESLVSLLSESLTAGRPQLSLVARLQPCKASIDTALSCGLVVNELVNNAVKHAFPKGRAGTITISLSNHSGRPSLEVSDNGVGLPAEFNPESDGGVGLEVVRSVSRMQLKSAAEVRSAPGGGVAWVVALPNPA